jgi:uncharacterized protein YgbK (DUF1537 family)
MLRPMTRPPTVAWYGDDFTGAAAVMEVLSFGGLPAVLFLGLPTATQFARFQNFPAVGLAGTARSKSPSWMEQNLPTVFDFLGGLGADIVQYKVCSTFDSSQEIGSIGRAYDIGARILGGDWCPLVVAAPAVHRYQFFGNLFASVSGRTFRLDRHPTMSRHPVTPMKEADVQLHLAQQTDAPIGLIDIVTMQAGRGQTVLDERFAAGDRIISIDIADNATLREAGRLVWENRGTRLFAIGSQGLEYALLSYWYSIGLVCPPAEIEQVAPVGRVVAISGSCSPVTSEQITWAESHGFAALRLDVVKVLGSAEIWQAEKERAIEAALSAVSDGLDPLIFTARGPDDPAIAAQNEAVKASNLDSSAVNLRIGESLGEILRQILQRTNIQRCIVAGGDTSGYVVSALGIYALTAVAPTVAGAALFRAYADNSEAQLEIALKGGQMGSHDYFGLMKGGTRP